MGLTWLILFSELFKYYLINDFQNQTCWKQHTCWNVDGIPSGIFSGFRQELGVSKLLVEPRKDPGWVPANVPTSVVPTSVENDNVSWRSRRFKK